VAAGVATVEIIGVCGGGGKFAIGTEVGGAGSAANEAGGGKFVADPDGDFASPFQRGATGLD